MQDWRARISVVIDGVEGHRRGVSHTGSVFETMGITMHGIILNGLKDFVVETYDDETWNRICDDADVTQRLFVPVTTYPDEQVDALVGSAAEISGEDAADLQRSFGQFLAPLLVETYGAHVDDDWTGLDLIVNVEEHIHKTLRAKKGAEFEPPAIDARRTAEDTVVVRYGSDRELCEVAKGIIDGVGDYYGESFEVTERECMQHGASECEIAVSQRGTAATDGGGIG